MQKVRITLAAFLCLALASIAQSQALPREVNFRFSEQLSNGPAGTCGCFTMEGGSADLYWNLKHFKPNQRQALGFAVDIGGEHTGDVNGAGYGLTLTTFAAGPRVLFPGSRIHTFAQALFGLAHGSGSQFPKNGALVTSANSFAFDAGGGVDIPLNKRISIRVLQLDYLYTMLPNNSTNWQNNLRMGAGFTLRLSH